MSSPSTSPVVEVLEGDATPAKRPLERRPTMANQAAMATKDLTRLMICGGLAGMIAKTLTNPLERIKMLAQTGEHGGVTSANHRQPPSVVGLYRDIIRREGVMGLWAGNGANLLRVFPAKAVVFSSNDFYAKGLRSLSGTPPDRKLSGGWSFLAGGLAGMTATVVTYPLDFARGRISGKLAAAAGQKTYKGIVQTMVLTVQDEGFLALYRGVTPTLLGAMPYEGIKFGTVGLMEYVLPPPKDDKPSPIRKMLFGGLGGVLAGLITYPNDTIRRLLQLQGSRGTQHTYAGYWDCAMHTYQQHGIGRFYHGLGINLIRMAPNAALQFYFYALLKQWTAGWT